MSKTTNYYIALWNLAFEIKSASVERDMDVVDFYHFIGKASGEDANTIADILLSIESFANTWNQKTSDVYKELEHIIESDEMNDHL